MNQVRDLSTDWGPELAPRLGECRAVETRLNCITCTASQRPATDKNYYNANTKCCSFWPFVPNYQVAEIPDFEALTESAVLPLGIIPTLEFQRKHRQASHGLRCPFLAENSRCGIWATRPARCATFFCESESGSEGSDFWEALHDIGNHFEQGLAQMWMIEAGYRWSEVEALHDLLAVGSEGVMTRERTASWAHWRGREREFFLAARQWRRRIRREDLSEFLGPEWIEMQQKAVDLHGLTSWAEAPRSQL